MAAVAAALECPENPERPPEFIDSICALAGSCGISENPGTRAHTRPDRQRAEHQGRDTLYWFNHSQDMRWPHGDARQPHPYELVLGPTTATNDVELLAFLTAPATLEIEQNGQV